jgi:hypothetical protein
MGNSLLIRFFQELHFFGFKGIWPCLCSTPLSATAEENQNLKAYVPNRTKISMDLVRIDRSSTLPMKAVLLVKTLTPNPIPPNLSLQT